MTTLARCSSRLGDRGVVTAMFAVLAVFFVLIISVLAEGGRKLSNLSLAEDLAAEAARAAAATLDVDQVAAGNAVIDTADGRARAAAESIVRVNDRATIERFDVNADSVYVAVRVSGDSYLPGFSIDGVGSHRAVAYQAFSSDP